MNAILHFTSKFLLRKPNLLKNSNANELTNYSSLSIFIKMDIDYVQFGQLMCKHDILFTSLDNRNIHYILSVHLHCDSY